MDEAEQLGPVDCTYLLLEMRSEIRYLVMVLLVGQVKSEAVSFENYTLLSVIPQSGYNMDLDFWQYNVEVLEHPGRDSNDYQVVKIIERSC